MKHGWFYTGGFMLIGMVAFGASPATADTAAGSYYATPSWDQQLQCDTPATCPRFIVLTNWSSAAVLDRETGLVWEQSPATATPTWSDARFQCTSRTVGGRKGWRLPSVHELASLIDPNAAAAPFLPAGHPFSNVPSAFFWSATTDAGDTTRTWIVSFSLGFVNGFVGTGVKSDTLSVWCVRGAMNADQY